MRLSQAAVAVLLSVVALHPATAQSAKTAALAGTAADASLVRAEALDRLKRTTSVIIPQFTVEFVERSDGLSQKEEKRQDYVEVDYEIAAVSDADRQAITDRLYARWIAALRSQGLSVKGPEEARSATSWEKAIKNGRPAPSLIGRTSGLNRLYTPGGVPFLLPAGASEPPATGVAADATNVGTAVAVRMGGKLGMLGGLGKMAGGLGSGLKSFGSTWSYASAEPKLAAEANAAVMTVHLVIGLRDTDMAGRGFGLFRTAGSYDGKPKLVVQGEGTEVTILPAQPDRGHTRAKLGVTKDLLFSEDLLAGKLEVANSAGATAANVINRARFATAAVGGGSAAINQKHRFRASPDAAAYSAAAERNLTLVQDLFLARLAAAW